MGISQKAKAGLGSGLPFVVFRKPDETTVTGIFQRGKVSHGCNKWTDSGFVFAPFHSFPCWILPDDDSDRVTETFVPQNAGKSAAPAPQIDNLAKANFEKLVQKAVDAISHATFSKVVLSRSETTTVPDFDEFNAFEKLASAYPSAFVYLWYHPETGIWLAATPEKLLKANGNQFETMSLAGTQKFDGDMEVSWPQKEQDEQLFVTDFILDSLSGIASGVQASAPYTVRAGNLLHIRTDINGTFSDSAGLGNAISALHPTPAVCGLPKAEARNFILQYEGYEREYYAGFLGELNSVNGTDLYVNLRCMRVSQGIAKIFVGCGITKDSVAEKEFLETVNKSLTIRKALI